MRLAGHGGLKRHLEQGADAGSSDVLPLYGNSGHDGVPGVSKHVARRSEAHAVFSYRKNSRAAVTKLTSTSAVLNNKN